jgi:hypothetical protein
VRRLACVPIALPGGGVRDHRRFRRDHGDVRENWPGVGVRVLHAA